MAQDIWASDPGDWELVILTPDAVYPGGSPYFEKAYLTWKETWEPVLASVGMQTPLSSDAFTRQHDRLALFYRGECAALTLFNHADLAQRHHLDDSYFACWPREAIEGLTREGPRILVCSYFTVTSRFRKIDFGFPVKDLLMGALIRYFVASPFDAMTGTLRNTKGINTLCYRWGANPLVHDVRVHGEPSDLVGFFKASVKPEANPEAAELLASLWEKRIIDRKPVQLRRVA